MTDLAFRVTLAAADLRVDGVTDLDGFAVFRLYVFLLPRARARASEDFHQPKVVLITYGHVGGVF